MSFPRESTPDWVRAGVVYEINPRAFSPTADFGGIRARLDDLAALGVTILWIMPVHPTGVKKRKGSLGSPYSARDYYAIDPALGSAADFRALVDAAHERGLRVILDIAANHTAWDSALIRQHPDWFRKDADGNIISSEPGWADVAALDYTQPEVRHFMTGVFEHWAREFDLDGFRCDIAGYMPVAFWQQVREALDAIRPDLFLLAEAESADLLDNAFDALYAWPFHRALNEVMMNGASASRLRQVWEHDNQRLPEGALQLRFTDNHDESRAIARFGERGALAAAALMFLLDGIPLIYNGQEAGDTSESGAPALFERIPIFWPNAERRPEFSRVFERLIELRRAHSALQQGEVQFVDNFDENRILSFLRGGHGQEFLVVVNLSNRPFQGPVDGSPQTVSLGAWGVLVHERRWGKMFQL